MNSNHFGNIAGQHEANNDIVGRVGRSHHCTPFLIFLLVELYRADVINLPCIL